MKIFFILCTKLKLDYLQLTLYTVINYFWILIYIANPKAILLKHSTENSSFRMVLKSVCCLDKIFEEGLLYVVLWIIQSSVVICKPPNILLIIADDLRTSLKCYGDQEAFTPNIDALAQHSFIFTRAYAQQALCGPSRTSILTSRSPHHLNQYDVHQYWRTSSGNFTSLPQFFKEKGFHTKSIGKIFHPGKCSNFVDDQPYSWSEVPFHPRTEKHKNDRVCPDFNGSGPSQSVVCPVRVKTQPGHTLPDLESLHTAKKFLEKYGREDHHQPFFLAVGFHKPHIPLKFPLKFLKYHPLGNISLPKMRKRPPNTPSAAWNPWIDMRRRDDIQMLNISFPWGAMPDSWAVKVKQSYYASVSYVDHLVGQLILKLEDIGQRNNTIILLTSDHGWSLGEHGEWSKYSNYEVSTNVPLLLSVPGKKGCRIGALVELLDVFPSLVDLAQIGESIPECVNGYTEKLCTDGRSLKPLIDSKENQVSPSWRQGAFSLYPRPGVLPTQFPDSDQPRLQDVKVMGYSVRTLQHRYTEWVYFDHHTRAPNWTLSFGSELYDHAIDPDENLNLSDRSHLWPLVESLRSILHSKWTS